MRDGNISNVPSPYIAFDIETVLLVLRKNTWKVKLLEFFGLYKFSEKYYKKVPGCVQCLSQLMEVGYNVMIVYFGRHWKSKMRLLNINAIPFTSLNRIATVGEFDESIIRDGMVMAYYTLSAYSMQRAGKKGELFGDWYTFMLDQINRRPE